MQVTPVVGIWNGLVNDVRVFEDPAAACAYVRTQVLEVDRDDLQSEFETYKSHAAADDLDSYQCTSIDPNIETAEAFLDAMLDLMFEFTLGEKVEFHLRPIEVEMTSKAHVSWSPEDIEEHVNQCIKNATSEEEIAKLKALTSADFVECLDYCAKQLKDDMIARGWDSIDTLFSMWLGDK